MTRSSCGKNLRQGGGVEVDQKVILAKCEKVFDDVLGKQMESK